MPLELGLFPGFAETNGNESWTVRAAIRLYADSAIALQPASGTSLTIAAGQSATAEFTMPTDPWPLGDGFFPLAVLVARLGEHRWSRESGLPLPNPPIMR
jgi:hypothetical protein